MERIIDLHIHTNCSDGEKTPFEIIDMAKERNISVISITDHDTVDAYTDELIQYAKKNNVKLISGVEISTRGKKCGIHVLGYNYNLNDDNFKNKLAELRNNRHKYLFDVSEKLNNLGYLVNTEELDKVESVTKAHIALDIINNKKNEKLLIDTFNHIPSKGEFIETIMNEGCPAYVKKKTVTPKEASELIKSAGGKVVLAHPVCYINEDGLTENEVLDIVNDMLIDGIEANYIYINKNNEKINDIKRWNKFAFDNKLFTTIGSDFHNEDGLHPTVGLINEDINLSNKEVNEIIDNVS
ncbi:MAG: PHP domain-containing protein [Bacilli bacterium]|nr:PHP domain-containing protein [Bacilli bacterium]